MFDISIKSIFRLQNLLFATLHFYFIQEREESSNVVYLQKKFNAAIFLLLIQILV